MHNLALALHSQGHKVTGSDDEIFDPALSRLKTAGILPSEFGWFPKKINSDLDAVILGMHAHADNPELARAKQLGLKIYSFPEYIYEQSKNKLRVVIGGSHGKTSITAMVMHVLRRAGKNFDYMVGSKLEGFELMVKLTADAPVIILEGDEYPDSALNKTPKFLLYKPDIAFISGLAWDHINIFPTYENYCEQFVKFVELVPADGKIIFNEEDGEVKKVIENVKSPAEKIAYHSPAYEIENGITYVKTQAGKIPMKVFGKHNLSNIEGAKAICAQLGVAENDFYKFISEFKGAANRLEFIGGNNSVSIYKDFAHSPSKLRATVNAVREQFATRKIIACMELHTFSSLTKDFLKEYNHCMTDADVKIVFFDPHTIELKRLEKITNNDVKKQFGEEDLMVMNNKSEIENFLLSCNYHNSVLLMMSSGKFGGFNLSSIVDFVLNQTNTNLEVKI